MEEQRKEEITESTDRDVVVPLFGREAPRRREPQASDDELAEYRRMLPLLRLLAKRAPELMQMLDDMDVLRNEATGCPVMNTILSQR